MTSPRLNGLRCLVGLLRRKGWVRSWWAQQSIDAKGNPLPWLTYGAIRFLESRCRPSDRVFEYGCGNSTLWWSARAAQVIAVEHDPIWAEKVRKMQKGNVTVEIETTPERYASAIAPHGLFDFIVIDGQFRSECVAPAVAHLRKGGCIVIDNTEPGAQGNGVPQMLPDYFRKMDFWGLGPINGYEFCTTVCVDERE